MANVSAINMRIIIVKFWKSSVITRTFHYFQTKQTGSFQVICCANEMMVVILILCFIFLIVIGINVDGVDCFG